MQKVLLDERLHRRIKAMAALDGTTIQGYVAEAVQQALVEDEERHERERRAAGEGARKAS